MSVTWSCSCFSRSADLTRATSAIWSIGLVRYSSAPASSPADHVLGVGLGGAQDDRHERQRRRRS